MKIRNTNPLVFTFVSLFAIVAMFFVYIPQSHAQSGQKWSDPINLSGSGAASNPLLVIDESGAFHVLWIDKYDGYKYTESTDGITWTPPKIVKFPFLPVDSQPVLIADSKGFIHIFWRNSKNILNYAKTAQENLGSPSAWLTTSIIDTTVYDFDVHLNTNGKLNISYIRNPVSGEEPSGVYYRQSTDGGFSWSGQKILYESQYFRSLTPEDAHIRIGVSGGEAENKVYVVWDDRSLKRIFMAKSSDAGLSWGASTEIVAPKADLGFESPFNIEIDEFKDTLLLMWQVGKPGVRCTQFSQWSTNDGESWSTPTKMFDEFITCPEKSRFLPVEQLYSMALMSIQGDLSLMAWNGETWSSPETESGLSFMSNPVTFDTIIFRCQQVVPYKNNLFVVGCDQGPGGDIWFTSRQLDPAEILFPPPSAWGIAKDVATIPQKISSLVSVPDQANNVHALWVQSALSDTSSEKPRILYARLSGDEWSKPAPIITELDGLPDELSVAMDNEQRLFLSWVNKDTGDLMFTWANSSRANAPSEWTSPIVLSSPSSLNSSPNILVDAANRIVVAYAVTVNEERGIYLVYSSDLGATWSSPIRVFDAVSAGWESVDEPKLALTGDGRLHVLFTQLLVLNGHKSVGLYYSQSSNGGILWSDPEPVSTQTVLWSEIVGGNGQKLHRLWQEQDKTTTVVYDQVSQDGGLSWLPATTVANVSTSGSAPALAVTGSDDLHLMQMTNVDVLSLQEWEWSGERWRALTAKKLDGEAQSLPVTITAGVMSKGILSALILFERTDEVAGQIHQLVGLNRTLDSGKNTQFVSAVVIATPEFVATPDALVDIHPTVTPIPPLANLAEPPSNNKNTVVLVFIVVAVVALLIVILPNRKKT